MKQRTRQEILDQLSHIIRWYEDYRTRLNLGEKEALEGILKTFKDFDDWIYYRDVFKCPPQTMK